MLALESQYPMSRLRQALLPWLLAVAVPLALGACDGANNALAPASEEPVAEPATAASEAAASGDALALTAGQRIVFQSYRSGNGDIYQMDQQGYHLVRLTSSADEERVPVWSYDNKRIALERPRLDASNVSHKDIYVINPDGSGGHWARATAFPYSMTDPSWSPDGARLVLSVIVQGASYIGWMDLATGQIGLFNASGVYYQGQQPSYDPTGQKIVYVGPGSTSVHQIKADGTGHKVLISSRTFLRRPAYSPDGKKVAYSKLIGTGDEEILVKNLADGTTTRLTYSTGEDASPSWSPDGTRIAFESRRSGTIQIWTMDAKGGSLLRITHNSGTELYPQWTH